MGQNRVNPSQVGDGARRGWRTAKAATDAPAGLRICDLLLGFKRDQGGNYLVVAGLAMPVLVGAAGLGTEVGLWLYKHQAMQAAADSGAISAATAFYNQGNANNLAVQAGAVTASYGFVDGASGVTVTVHQPPVSGAHLTTPGAVEVSVQQTQKRLFSAIWNSQSLTISARSVAYASGGNGCVLALDPAARGAATLQGTSQVTLNGCSLFDNSNEVSALTVGGSARLTALSVGVVGGISGTADITTTQGIVTGQSPVADPYASASFGSFSGCSHHNFSAKTIVTIGPGVYCGGVSLNAGANVTLNPGVYYIDQGSFSVNGGATLTGTGVTLVFTSSTGSNYATASINGGATVNLTAPTSGPTAGIVVFGDRNMPVDTTFKFNGGASQILGGAIYLSKAAVDFAGGAGTSTGCSQLIGNTVKFVGNSNFAINCSGTGTKALGSAVAKLVE